MCCSIRNIPPSLSHPHRALLMYVLQHQEHSSLPLSSTHWRDNVCAVASGTFLPPSLIHTVSWLCMCCSTRNIPPSLSHPHSVLVMYVLQHQEHSFLPLSSTQCSTRYIPLFLPPPHSVLVMYVLQHQEHFFLPVCEICFILYTLCLSNHTK